MTVIKINITKYMLVFFGFFVVEHKQVKLDNAYGLCKQAKK